MTFTTSAFILAGLAASAVPIVLHFLAKGAPKPTPFSALRLLRPTHASTRRRFALKRFLLLALRVLLFALLGLALARPHFTPRIARESAERSSATAVALAIDASPRMARVKNNARLFDAALGASRAILDQLPPDCEIATLSSGADGDAFEPDRFAAKERLEKLEIDYRGRSIAETLVAALETVRRSSLPRREIYVATDGASAGWSERDMRRVRAAYESFGENPPTIYFLDLGDDGARNATVADVALSSETVSTTGTLRVDVEVERVGDGEAEIALELLLFRARDLPSALTPSKLARESEAAFRRETQTLRFGAGRVKRVASFQATGLPVGGCVGLARLLGGDALAEDDARAFAFDVEPERRLLVVANDPVERNALFFAQALAPDDLRQTGRAPYELDFATYDATKSPLGGSVSLANLSLRDYEKWRAVALLDPPGLDASTWTTLAKYAENGGGVGVFLGRRAAPIAAFQTPEATRLLGCKPTTATTATTPLALAPRGLDEPLFAPFRAFARDATPWDALPVYKYWTLADATETATVAARFVAADSSGDAENAPIALVENRVGLGLVATLATPISDPDDAWNAMPLGDAPWTYVLFADGIAQRLASGTSAAFNYAPGELVSLRAPVKRFPDAVDVYSPDAEPANVPTDAERRQIRFVGANLPGFYRVKTRSEVDADALDLVFAVAPSPDQFDMTRPTPEEWTKLWDGVPLKPLDLSTATSTLAKARSGGEGAPYAALVALLALVFLLETRVSNRFYQAQP